MPRSASGPRPSMRGRSCTLYVPGSARARKCTTNQPTWPGATYGVDCTATPVPSGSASAAWAPSMPRYQPAEPVLRRATTHSTVPLGVVVGYAPSDSNSAPYAPRGGTSKGAGESPAVAVAAGDARVAERSALTRASSSGDATNAMSARIPIAPASTAGGTRMRPMSRSGAEPTRSGTDIAAGHTAPTIAVMFGNVGPPRVVSFFTGRGARADEGRACDATLRSERRGAAACTATRANERTGAATRDVSAVTLAMSALTRAVMLAASDVSGDASRPRGMRARAARTS